MAKYKLKNNGILNTETGMFIPEYNNGPYKEEYLDWAADGNTPDPEFTEEEIAQNEFNESLATINAAYEASLNEPVECVVNETTYYMDGKYDSASRFKQGIDLAITTDQTSMLVVDFYDEAHIMSIEDAMEINTQQAVGYLERYTTRAMARDALIKSSQ